MPQVYSSGYADDLGTLTRGPDLSIVAQHAQESINIVEKWIDGVNKSTSGWRVTKWLPFYSPEKGSGIRQCFAGIPIPFVKHAKFLGVILDNKLTWKPHCIDRANKGLMAMAVCKRAVGPTWGLRPSTVMWIYKTIVRPTMEYGALVWCSASMVKTHMKLFDRVQRVALMSTSGSMKSTPSASLECLFGVEPMDVRIQRVAYSTMLRLELNQQWLGWYGRGFKGPMSHMDLCNQLSIEVSAHGPSKVDRSRVCKEWTEKVHKSRWRKNQLCKQTKMFLKEPYQANLGNITKLNRDSLRLLVQVITGHNSLNSHLFKMNLAPSPDCICGQGKETGYHFITECDCHCMTRLAVLGGLKLTSEELLDVPFARLARYIARTGRFLSDREGHSEY